MIRDLIKEYGIAKFSRETGVDLTYLSRYVNGKRCLTVHLAPKMLKDIYELYAKEKGVSIQDLVVAASQEIVEDISDEYMPNVEVVISDGFKDLNKRRFLDLVGKNRIIEAMYEDFLRTSLKWEEVRKELPALIGLFRGKSKIPTWRTMIRAARLFGRPDDYYIQYYLTKELEVQ